MATPPPTAINNDGLCPRCATIEWDEMAYAIETHFPMVRHLTNRRVEVFDMNTTITDNEEVLTASQCRFCNLLAKALDTHNMLVPGKLECVHEDSEMVSMQIESMLSAFAVMLDGDEVAEERFRKEYACVREVDYESLRAEIHACEQSHAGCVPDVLGDLPGFRFIDCRSRVVVAASMTKSQDHNTGYHYVALSYVWGPKPDESRLNEHGALENLPRTIDDAIELCRGLGYRYLWVDRYCIDQTNAKEKAIQIANMGKIYSSAQLTVIASVGQGPEYGLPGLSADKEDIPFVHEKIKRLVVALRPLNSLASIATSKWSTRGWTYQEGYLSRKRIFFTNKGIHYICNATTTTLSIQRFLPRPVRRIPPLPSAKPYSEVNAWTARLAPLTRNLEAYSARQLSVDSDALDAITGALNAQAAQSVPVHHLWGVPICETDIDFDLVSANKFSKGKVPTGAPLSIEFLIKWNHTRPCRRRLGFPSWSFLGWAGQVHFRSWPRQIHLGPSFEVHNLQKSKTITSQASDLHHPLGPMTENETPRFSLSPPGTKILDVSIYTLPLTLVHVTWTDTTPQKDPYETGHHISAPLHDGTEIFFPVQWSRDPTTLPAHKPLLGALFISERKLQKPRSSTVVFVLMEYGGVYERVGLAIFRGSEVRSTRVERRAGASVEVDEWEERYVSMREWMEVASKQRIRIG